MLLLNSFSQSYFKEIYFCNEVPTAEIMKDSEEKEVHKMEYVRIIQGMYDETRTSKKCVSGKTENFTVKVGNFIIKFW